MKKGLHKGFTLVELLVVVAIITVLSSVVLASTGAARNKGADAAAKSDVNSIRTQIELLYASSANGNYGGVCSNNAVVKALNDASKNESLPLWTGQSDNDEDRACITNGASSAYWVAYIHLQKSLNVWYCVDNSGGSKTLLTSPGTSATSC